LIAFVTRFESFQPTKKILFEICIFRMEDRGRLSINKSTVNVPFRRDPEIDLTAIRIGKNRIARKKDAKLSDVKQAILSHRQSTVQAPTITSHGSNNDEFDPPGAVERPGSSPYISQCLSEELDLLVFKLLKELSRLQARGVNQPVEKRYKYKKFVAGIREVERSLNRGELKGVVVATNLETGVDVLDNLLLDLKTLSEEKEIPFVISLSKRKLGKALGKSMKQSVVGITNLDGVHQEWKIIIEQVESLRRKFIDKTPIQVSEL
jgi:ribosomal protein L7Ae-like RNA K-turn-binding protein